MIEIPKSQVQSTLLNIHPSCFHIYSGRKEKIHQFVAVGEKKGGTALGAIFKKATQIETDKQWMGKVGNPGGLLRSDPNTIRTRTKKEINLDTIKEKLAYDLYAELGRGLFLVPKTRLSLQPIINPYNMNALAVAYVQMEISETLRIMSAFLPGYQDFSHARTLDGNEKISFMEYIKKNHRPPEAILTSEGVNVPLEGIMELLAVGRCLADVDLLGGSGRNAGFVWIRNSENAIVKAFAVKIDPGYAFCWSHEDLKNPSENQLINTLKSLGSVNYFLQDLKDIQTSTSNLDTVIRWACLSKKQREAFLSVLLKVSRFTQSQEILELLFYRKGGFTYPDHQYSDVAYIPQKLAEHMSSEMTNWVKWQLEIYTESLTLALIHEREQHGFQIFIRYEWSLERIYILETDTIDTLKKIAKYKLNLPEEDMWTFNFGGRILKMEMCRKTVSDYKIRPTATIDLHWRARGD